MQVAAVTSRESRMLLKTTRAFTQPIVPRRLDGPERGILTRLLGMPIVRVSHEAADLETSRVPDWTD